MRVTGVFMLLAGLVILVPHNPWSGGAVAQSAFYQSLHFAQFYYGYLAIGLVLWF